MIKVESSEAARTHVTDCVMDALVAGLDLEFGRGAGEALARRFLEAEETDFRWDARSEERWLGACDGHDGEGLDFDRIAICGRLDGTWFCATMLVDGEGRAHAMVGCRQFGSFGKAQVGMRNAH